MNDRHAHRSALSLPGLGMVSDRSPLAVTNSSKPVPKPLSGEIQRLQEMPRVFHPLRRNTSGSSRSLCASITGLQLAGVRAGGRARPALRGVSPVNSAACDGIVQPDGAYICGAAEPRRASCANAGLLPGGAPYGSNTLARAVSNNSTT